ncbi:hypothetical protein [uncultured Maritimibacter sp.]|jgi:hypothetical protein|uniref:hypothetical protein n=1 Tax=uncultured Maritimibacter sp. TaxID=991866 RepID=UPI002627374D|nr:hypothetical protein [uncultured Maritimibacter sp.]
MVAIVVFLFLSGRTIATSMAVVRPGTVGPAPLGAGTSWKAAGDSFFVSRCNAEGGGKKLAADVAGRRARRSRSSVRPCQIEDADGAPITGNRVEYGNGGRPAPRRNRGLSAGSLAAVFPDPTDKAGSPYRQQGPAVWSRLIFAGAAVSGVAGRSLAGRCAMLGQVDGLGFPALIRLPVGVDGKPNLMGLPGRSGSTARIAPVYPGGACREMAAAAAALR